MGDFNTKISYQKYFNTKQAQSGLNNLMHHTDKMFTFDVETTGLKNDQGIWSAAFAEWGDEDAREVYLQLSKEERRNASSFSKPFMEAARPNIKKEISPLELLLDINKQLDKTPIMTGHNLSFDMRKVMSYAELNNPLINEQLIKLQTRMDPLGVNIGMSISEIEDILSSRSVTKKEVSEIAYWKQNSVYTGGTGKLLLDANATRKTTSKYHEAWSKINKNVEMALASKVGGVYTKAAIVDSFTISKIMLGMASQANITRRDGEAANKFLQFGDNINVGHKLDTLAELIGIDTAKIGHTRWDVIMNQSVLEAVVSDINIIAAGGEISHANLKKETNAMLEYFEDISTPEFDKGTGLKNDAYRISENNLQSQMIDMAYRERIVDINDSKDLMYFDTGPKGEPRNASSSESVIFKQISERYTDFNEDEVAKLYIPLKDDLYGLTGQELEDKVDSMRKNFSEANHTISSRIWKEKTNKFKIMERPPHISSISSKEALQSLKSSITKGALVVAGLIAASTLISMGTNSYEKEVSSDDDNYNGDYSPIEKLQRINIQPSNTFQTANSYQTASFFKRKNEFVSTAGIGLEMSKHMTNHYVM